MVSIFIWVLILVFVDVRGLNSWKSDKGKISSATIPPPLSVIVRGPNSTESNENFAKKNKSTKTDSSPSIYKSQALEILKKRNINTKRILNINYNATKEELRSKKRPSKMTIITSLYYYELSEDQSQILAEIWMYSLHDVVTFFKDYLYTDICYGYCTDDELLYKPKNKL